MSLQGQAFLGIWHGLVAGHEQDFDCWHTYEHMPERAGIPGFKFARRYMNWDLPDRVCFTMYEGAHLETFRSPGYLARLNAPTEWTRRISAVQTHFLRGGFETVSSMGAGIGGAIGTYRLQLASDARAQILKLVRHACVEALGLHGVVGVHLGSAQRDITSVKTAETAARASSGVENSLDAVVLIESIGFEEAHALIDAASNLLKVEGVQLVEAAPYRLAYVLPGA
jgi:hypothetical protein